MMSGSIALATTTTMKPIVIHRAIDQRKLWAESSESLRLGIIHSTPARIIAVPPVTT